jgi:hypothetical protein
MRSGKLIMLECMLSLLVTVSHTVFHIEPRSHGRSECLRRDQLKISRIKASECEWSLQPTTTAESKVCP